MYKCCVFFQVNLGPDKMVVDLTDPNRPRFTLQELRDVLQERNKFKSQLLLVQEELQCYRRWAPLRGRGAGGAAPPSLAQPGAPRHAAGLFWRPSTPGQRPGGGAAAVSRAEDADAAEMLLLEGKDGQVWC